MVKGFGFPLEYVLYDLSYANLAMLGATLPNYGRRKETSSGEEIIDASDPRNKDRVRNFLDSIE